MTLDDRISAFTNLGLYLQKEIAFFYERDQLPSALKDIVKKAEVANTWFDESSVIFSLKQISRALEEERLLAWLAHYDKDLLQPASPKRIGLVMAGNIPLVGFHDFLSVLISGHTAVIKMSSEDKILLPFLAGLLKQQNTAFSDRIIFCEEKLAPFDAVIATGSDNTARYFDYYFGKYPHIIRQNRNSIAILTGKETRAQLELLANDIALYCGRGCRSVSLVFVPDNYDVTILAEALKKHRAIAKNSKFFNNYEYQKAIHIVNKIPFTDSGFMLLTESDNLAAPISVLNYSFYDKIATIKAFIASNKKRIQCVVSESSLTGAVPFGNAQKPELTDYADNIDTLEFLTRLGAQ